MPGFIEIDRHRFYGEIWPRIRQQAEAIESNWKAVHTAINAGQQPPELRIKWGYKIKETEEKVVLAITHAIPGRETHWIAPELN